MSYINIIYKGNMVKINEQEIHLNYLMEEIAKVLLFINSALDFTKIISTMYTGLYINFFFKNTLRIQRWYQYRKWETHNRGKQSCTKARTFTCGFLNKIKKAH